MLDQLYLNQASSNLKMPFIPHINMALTISDSIKHGLIESDHRKLKTIILFHDLIMIYKDFKFPEYIATVLMEYKVNILDLRTISFKHLRDKMGHNDWDVIVPQYVSNVINYDSEVCLIHCLICWLTHVIYCIRNDNKDYLRNLSLMFHEFENKINLKLKLNSSAYRYKEIIVGLLGQYNLQLIMADLALGDDHQNKIYSCGESCLSGLYSNSDQVVL